MSRFVQFWCAIERHSSSSCLEKQGISYSYGALIAEVERWQGELDAMRLEAGSVIGLLADYSLSAVAALLALGHQRSIVALIPRDRAPDGYLADALASALLEVDSDGTFRYRRMAERPAQHPLLEQLRDAAEPGLILFTSGSTGRPKAALHSMERFLHKFDRPGRSLRTLAFLLFDHVAGMDTLFYTLWHGGTLVLTRWRDPMSILDLIESQQVEALPTSPSFLRLLCALNDTRSRDLSSLKVITYGSEPMDITTLQRVNERFPNAQIVQKYGTTEAGSPRTTSQANDSLRVRFKDGLQTRVLDGVLWLRSEGTMLGYLNAPSPVSHDGWYCTGDLVEVDGEWIRFLGRADEIIKVAGEKVVPAEVENVIRELKFVRDVFVHGEPHPLMGAVVSARVAVSPAVEPKAAAVQIRRYCRERLGPYCVPLKIDLLYQENLGVLAYRQKDVRRGSVLDTRDPALCSGEDHALG